MPKIFVCIKQVPDTEAKIKIASNQEGIESAGIKWVMNPYDEYAVEEAIKIRDASPGPQVHVISVGPKQRVVESLRTALAMGADEAIVIDAPENLDSLSTAKVLAEAIKAEGDASLILMGKLAIDDNQSAVPQMVASFLGIPHATVVSKLQNSPESVQIERDIEGGAKEVLVLQKPAVLSANKGLNTPRYASLPGIMKAKKKTIKELASSQFVQDADKKVAFKSFSLPAEKPPVKMVAGDPGQQAQQLVALLKNEAKVL